MDLETLNTWHKWLDVKTEDLKIETVKKILAVIRTRIPKETFKKDNTFLIHSAEISAMLMCHLKHGLPTTEEQSICSLTYCSTLHLMSNESVEDTLQEIFVILFSFQRKLYGESEDSEPTIDCQYSRKCNIMIIGLINGLFKSDSVHKPEGSALQKVNDCIVLASFKIVAKMCLLYSNVTFHSFKTLHVMLEKILVWGIVDKVMASDMDRVIIFVISSNWENSISGVREINSKLLKTFRLLMDASKNSILDAVKDVTLKYPWNRAKYLILCEVLPDLRDDRIFEDLKLSRDGLELSLQCSSLVSAGSSLYKTMIGNLTLEKWRERFFVLFKNNMLSKERCIQTNILNHWLLPTLKIFPEVFDILIDLFVEKSSSDNDHYALLYVLKIGRKTGRIFTDWRNVTQKEQQFKDAVYYGLRHIDEDVRSQAFQVVCGTHQFNVISEEECKIVKDFLITNINYNSTSFCNSTINSFTVVFIRLIESFLCVIKKIKVSSDDDDRFYIEEYFIWIHEFIMQNLEQPGNYHRKIFSLHINEIVLRYLYPSSDMKQSTENTTGHTKNGSYRKAPNLARVCRIVEYLEGKNKWHFKDQDNIQALIKCIHDSTDDVRELTTSILIGHYSVKLLQYDHITRELFTNGLVLCNSRMFYEMESGCLMFKIIASLMEQPDLPLEGCSDLVEYLFKKATNQFDYQKSDLLLSIYDNKPLYGLISALKMTVKYLNSYSMTDDTLQRLISLSGAITSHFLDILACKSESDSKDYPPSFAEMSDSIEHVIDMSAHRYDPVDGENNLHISNAHHLVLNNIWLNLDASCGLSSTLLLKYVTRMDIKTVGDCLNVIVTVLTRCRHKGAIEHAGATLGITVRHLTSLMNPGINELISLMLRDFLVQATSADESHGGSITRKSAGFTILVDKIISNDSREEKPLFYLAMDILLNALKSSKNPGETSEPFQNGTPSPSLKLQESSSLVCADDFSNERDVPLARALHLLCRTVANSSLARFVVQFASELTTVCFDHLTSEQWQVRNAALQLYGALVPKIIGQKSNRGEETCPVSPYELFVHVPSLWHHIRRSLSAAHNEESPKNILIVHSDLVPVLSLLSSMAREQNYYPACREACAQLNVEPVHLEDIFDYLCGLLGSPIYAVRNISAKIIQSYYSLTRFYKHFQTKSAYSENELHGYLTALKHYVFYYNSVLHKYLLSDKESSQWCSIFLCILEKIHVPMKKSSYLVKILFLEVENSSRDIHHSDSRTSNEYIDLAKDSVKLYNECINNKQIQMGIRLWIDLEATIAINACQESDLVTTIEVFLNAENAAALIEEVCMPVLKNRLKTNTFTQKHVYESLCETIISSKVMKSVGKNTFRVLYLLALNIPVLERISSKDSDILLSRLNLNHKSSIIFYNQGYLLPLLCLINNNSSFVVLQLSRVCRRLSKPHSNEFEHRYIAATSVYHLIKTVLLSEDVRKNSDDYEIKANVIMSAIWLLQDESSDVRNQCSKMSFKKDESIVESIHPNVHLENIFSSDFLLEAFGDSAVIFLETVLSEIPTSETSKEDLDLQNPFDHNTSNTYWEPELMRENIANLILAIRNID